MILMKKINIKIFNFKISRVRGTYKTTLNIWTFDF